MADQIVITEKSCQAKDVRAAVGSRYGDILAAEVGALLLAELDVAGYARANCSSDTSGPI